MAAAERAAEAGARDRATDQQPPPAGLERAAYLALLAFAAAPQFSIAAAGILLGLTSLLWLALVITRRERIEVPSMFWPLAAYAGITLVSSAFSIDPAVSFLDSKQLVLFAIVPIVYRLARARAALTVVDVIITVGAAERDLRHHPVRRSSTTTTSDAGVQGNLGHYMTYSGVLMLVACTAAARVMFRGRDGSGRRWSCRRCSSRWP